MVAFQREERRIRTAASARGRVGSAVLNPGKGTCQLDSLKNSRPPRERGAGAGESAVLTEDAAGCCIQASESRGEPPGRWWGPGGGSGPGQAEDLQEVAEVGDCVVGRTALVDLRSLVGIEHDGRQ